MYQVECVLEKEALVTACPTCTDIPFTLKISRARAAAGRSSPASGTESECLYRLC